MKKILLAAMAAFVLVTTASAQVLNKQGVQNTLWTGVGLPPATPGDDDRPGYRWLGLIDTVQARLDYNKFTMDGMLAWGALTSWRGHGISGFSLENTTWQQFTFMDENRKSDSYYLNFVVHPFDGFDAGMGTELNWSVGPYPSTGGKTWAALAHVIQGDMTDGKNVQGGKAVMGSTRYAYNYAKKALGVRYRYEDILEAGFALPSEFNQDRPAANVGFKLHPIDLITAAFAYENLFVDGGNLYTGLTLDFSKEFYIDAYLAIDGIGYNDNDYRSLWGTGGAVFLKLPGVPVTIRPEIGFTFYNNSNFTNAWYTGGRAQWDISKKMHLGGWVSFAWGAKDKRWEDDAEKKNWEGGYIFNLRPDFTFDVDNHNSVTFTTEFERVDHPDKSSDDKILFSLFWTYRSF